MYRWLLVLQAWRLCLWVVSLLAVCGSSNSKLCASSLCWHCFVCSGFNDMVDVRSLFLPCAEDNFKPCLLPKEVGFDVTVVKFSIF